MGTVTIEGKPNDRSAVKIGWAVYQQVAAILSAFALIAFLSHFIDFDWRGPLRLLVGVWNETVRPAERWLLHALITVPLSWIGRNFEVSQPVRDYLAVGMVLWVSMIRASVRGTGDFARSNLRPYGFMVMTSNLLFLWPLL